MRLNESKQRQNKYTTMRRRRRRHRRSFRPKNVREDRINFRALQRAIIARNGKLIAADLLSRFFFLSTCSSSSFRYNYAFEMVVISLAGGGRGSIGLISDLGFFFGVFLTVSKSKQPVCECAINQ